MKSERLHYLFNQYFDKKATAEEAEELMEMLDYSGNDADVETFMQRAWQSYDPSNEMVFTKIQSEQMWSNIAPQQSTGRRAPVITLMKRIAVAASVILVAGAGIWYFSKQNKKEIPVVAKATQDVAPGGNKAVLTLGDGSSIVLDHAANGQLAMQGNTSVAKLNNGELAYNAQNGHAVFYNSLATPRGGHYKITLPDGSIVWLNSASSLRFPTSFNGDKREVEMSGEAYFEIAKNVKQPFIVKVNDGSKVEVLGTHFNVMAYGDEDEAKTTLLQGAVKVDKGNASNLLKPGQQAAIEKDGKMKVLSNVNISEVTAWKEDQFSFNSADIHSIMKQISRWYDVDVEYKGNVSASLNGNIKMSVPLSQVLEILTLAGNVKFDVQGKKIVVSQE